MMFAIVWLGAWLAGLTYAVLKLCDRITDLEDRHP